MKRKLIAYTDTKREVLKDKVRLKRHGFKNFVIKKQYGGYALFGKKTKR